MRVNILIFMLSMFFTMILLTSMDTATGTPWLLLIMYVVNGSLNNLKEHLE